MGYQSGKNVVVAYKVEGAFNTPPGTGSAKQLRLNASPGMTAKAANIESGEVRSDSLSSMGRKGSKMTTGSYTTEMSLGAIDDIFEALMRSTWVAAVTITQATAGLTSISTPTTSTILASAGSWITAGVRVGDVVRLTGFATAANNSINLRVKAVSALTLTVQGTPLTIDAGLDTTFTLTILKKLKNPAAATKRSFYIEQYMADTAVDASEVFGGCKFIQMKVTGTPDGMALCELQILGAQEGTPLSGASAPYFINPTLTTGIPLVFADATINVGGVDVLTATAFEFTYTIKAKTEPVVGSAVSPDVFDNDAVIKGSISFVRSDLARVSAFLAETESELHVMLVEPESEPKDCIAFYIPRIKFDEVAAGLGNDGAMIEVIPFGTGKKEGAGATGYDDTLMTISTSAP